MEKNADIILVVTALVYFVTYVIIMKYMNRRKIKIQSEALEKQFKEHLIGFVDVGFEKFVDADKKDIPGLSDLYWDDELENCFAARYIPYQIELPLSDFRAFHGHILMDKSYEFDVAYISRDNVILNSPELGDMIIPLNEVSSERLAEKLKNCAIGNKFLLPGGILFDE